MISYSWYSGILSYHYIELSLPLLIILLFYQVILSVDKTNRFPKLFVISNVFLIKIAVVVLYYSSQQRDPIIPLFRIFFFLFSLDLCRRKLLRSFDLCIIALGNSLFIKRKWLPGIYFLLCAAYFSRLLIHTSMKLLISPFQVSEKDTLLLRFFEICDYEICCNPCKFLFQEAISKKLFS